MLPPMQLDFEIDLTPDAEVLYGAADTFRLVIDHFYLFNLLCDAMGLCFS